jgi:hypothetical protein
VKVALVRNLADYTRLLEEVVVDVGSNGLALGVEVDFEVFSESRGVVVPQRLCVSERLKQRICGQHHVHHLLNLRVLSTGDVGNVLHEAFRSLGLSCAGLARDDDTLVLLIGIHVVVGGLGDCENVRGHFQPVLALVALQDLLGVDAHCALSALGLSLCSCLHVQSRKGLTDTSTCPMYVCVRQLRCPSISIVWRIVSYVDFAILEALLQVVVDGLVGDLADQRQIRHAHLLLLGALEDGLGCELRLGLPWPRCSAGSRCVLLAPGALGYRLHALCQCSISCRAARAEGTMADARPRAPGC